MGLDISHVIPVLEDLVSNVMRPMYLLEAELTYIQIAQGRVLGLSPERVDQIEKTNYRRNCILVRRLTSGNPLLN
jgi:DNA-directed RNA polymerase sigma subunit (sigma70/sigma32)